MFRVFTALSFIYTSRLLHNNMYDLLFENNLQSPQLFILENQMNEINQTKNYESIDQFLAIQSIFQ